MRVFLSWSGDRSRRLAESLRDWLPSVIQSIEPWLSSEDISKGSRWAVALGEALKQTDAGIICLTPENSQAGWLLFEAGAISNITTGALVAVYSLDQSLADVSGPLAQFQCSQASRDDTYRLVKALNKIDRNPLPEDRLRRSFDLWWPQLDANLTALRASTTAPVPSRASTDKLDEILALVRDLARASTSASTPLPMHDSLPSIAPKGPTKQRDRPRVFIGSSVEGLEVAYAVQQNLDDVAECTVWNQAVFQPSKTFIESLVDVTAEFDFAVLVLTPDDILVKRGTAAPVARDNLLFELGLFTGALGRARTFLIHEETATMHLPSDLLGVTAATYKPRKDGNLVAALGPVCNRIRRAMGAG